MTVRIAILGGALGAWIAGEDLEKASATKNDAVRLLKACFGRTGGASR